MRIIVDDGQGTSTHSGFPAGFHLLGGGVEGLWGGGGSLEVGGSG